MDQAKVVINFWVADSRQEHQVISRARSCAISGLDTYYVVAAAVAAGHTTRRRSSSSSS